MGIRKIPSKPFQHSFQLETGSALDEYVTEKILEPLQMNDSYYYHPGALNDTRRDLSPSLYVGGEVEAVKVHYLVPRRYEIVQELLL